jgi:outer membrane protein assembly factor BamB
MPLLFKSHSQCLVGICDNQYNFHTFNRKTGILVTSISLLPAGEKAFPMGPSGAAFDGKVIYAVANSLSNNTFSTQQLAKPLTQGKELSLLNTLAREVKSTLTAFKSSSGKILWQNSFESAVLGVPSVANHLIFIGFFNGYFRVLDAKTGKTLFEFSSGPVSGTYGLPPYNLNTPFTSTAVISDGKVFLAGGFTYPQDASKTIPGGLFSFGIPPKDTSEISY